MSTLSESKEVVLEDVSVRYAEGPAILENLTIRIPKGDSLLIEGKNGTGKSSLGQVLAGSLTPSTGQVTRPYKVCSFIEPVNFPSLTLEDLISKEDLGQFHALMKSLGLSVSMTKLYEELSFGQKKKFTVARALCERADYYVFDEPNSGVDDTYHKAVITTILQECKRQEKSVIIIAHQVEGIRPLFNQCLNLNSFQSTKPFSEEALEVDLSVAA